ncbi:hypothetical protein B0T19DRAFT_426092 [Cercophora scortea]|uniref:Uncharacterized protein n=1 Tax=Cercophora scortea TaxID=314031 RepID=A0AAE0IEL7_9PEZI|nr:hypothetical protein B0T19DRAFT_426092 [Cercophora scortea]
MAWWTLTLTIFLLLFDRARTVFVICFVRCLVVDGRMVKKQKLTCGARVIFRCCVFIIAFLFF